MNKKINASCFYVCGGPNRPKAPTQVRPSFGITRPIPSPNYRAPSPQQQQQTSQQTQSSAKLKKEKKKPLVPFHHRPSMDKDRPEAAKSHVGAMTKGLPTANVLTSGTQKRHPDVAFPHNGKKYSMQGPPTPLQNTSGVPSHKTHGKSEMKVSQPSASLLRMESSIMPSQSVADGLKLLVKTNEPCTENFVGNKDCGKKDEMERNCYCLPEESGFSVPALPLNPLDCRPLSDLSIPTAVSSPSPLEKPLSVWER